jgi:flagellar motor switch protein FliM
MTATPVVFDFRKPPPGELGRRASQWLTAACRRAVGPWSRTLPFPTELSLTSVELTDVLSAFQTLPEDTVALPLNAVAPAEGTLVLALPRPVLLTILAGLVGEVPQALPADREPTDLEQSLLGFLAHELFIEPLVKSWPQEHPPQLQPGGLTSPRRAWRGPLEDLILRARLSLKLPFGEYPVYLLIPRSGIGAVFAHGETSSAPPMAEESATIEEVVQAMPVDLTVVLGTAELSMEDVARLQTGDVVILRQKIDQPLDGLLSGMRKFRVWPGVIGQRAAVVIDSAADEL